jgi:hypothetical protein
MEFKLESRREGQVSERNSTKGETVDGSAEAVYSNRALKECELLHHGAPEGKAITSTFQNPNRPY